MDDKMALKLLIASMVVDDVTQIHLSLLLLEFALV